VQEKKKFDLVLFDSSHHAFAFDQKAKEASLGGRLIPVPRELSASCGMCYRSQVESRNLLKSFMENDSIKFNKIVHDFEL
jgi:hypothetical protein epulo_09810